MEIALRPNILFAFADDWGRYASAYRNQPGENNIHELIKTPNFDKIANEGALFLNANVPAPSCTPCRSSILSGKYFWQTGMGAILRGARWDEAIPTYPLMVEEAGYHIGYTYKVWSPGLSINAPYGGARTSYQSHGSRFNNFSEEVSKRPPGQSVEEAKNELIEETRQNFQSFLDSRPTDKPFCYWWGPTNTHRTWQQGSGKEIWGLDPDNLTKRMPDFLPDVPEIREDFNDYLGECQAVDAGLGAIIEQLEKTGEIDNTIIVVSGDHGIPGFPRAKCNLYNLGTEVALAIRWPGHISEGRIISDFVNLMDLAPTFLDIAEVEKPSDMVANSLIPLLESSNSGRVEETRDFVVTGRERHGLAREGYLPYPSRAIRTDDFLYIYNFAPDRWPIGDPKGLEDDDAIPPSAEDILESYDTIFQDIDKGPTKVWMIYNRGKNQVKPLYELAFGKRPLEELYDLRVDPDYMSNVAEQSEYQIKKNEMKTRLMSILENENDPRVTESPSRFDLPPFAGPVPKEWTEESNRESKRLT